MISKDEFVFTFFCDHDSLIDFLKKNYSDPATRTFDLVFQLGDDGYCNDPGMEIHITALLEMFGIPYTGTGTRAMGLSYDKDVILQVAKTLGMNVPKSKYFQPGVDAEIIASMHGIEYPVIVKPNNTDGSFGITHLSVCHNEREILAAVNSIRNTFLLTCAILVQEYLGGDDITYAFLGNPDEPQFITSLPITIEDYSQVPTDLPRILTFDSKFDPSSPYWKITTRPAKLSEEVKATIISSSIALASRLGYRDYMRFDWRSNTQGVPHLLEVNPNCGWGHDDHMCRMSALAGISYSEMLRSILNIAKHRAAKMVRDDHVNMDTVMKKINMK